MSMPSLGAHQFVLSPSIILILKEGLVFSIGGGPLGGELLDRLKESSRMTDTHPESHVMLFVSQPRSSRQMV